MPCAVLQCGRPLFSYLGISRRFFPAAKASPPTAFNRISGVVLNTHFMASLCRLSGRSQHRSSKRCVFALVLLLGLMACLPSTHAQTPLNDIVQVVAGGGHTCGLTASGGVKCWGENDRGQLGDGTTNLRLTPVHVTGLSSEVSAIAVGSANTCALTSGGGVKCWGSNDSGQLGDGTTADRWTATDVSGLSSGVSAIAAGSGHTCALTTQGGVKCWGANGFGQLGDGSAVPRLTAVDVSGLSSGISAIASDLFHTCAVTAGGGVKCWGYNNAGQLGDGSTTDRLTPVDVSELGGGVSAIAPGGYHTCALTTGGGLKCWGLNFAGQLGDGTTTDRLIAVDVSELTSGVAAVTTGFFHTCALTSSGGVKCWGLNHRRQLGDGSLTERWTAADVSGLSVGNSTVAAGFNHTCAVTAGRMVKCWGDNIGGQLGDGTASVRSTPVNVAALNDGLAAVATGGAHSCALSTGGGVKCWGFNSSGQLGDGSTVDRFSAVDVHGLGSGASAVATGRLHTCALGTGGGVQCWGDNTSGQLGDGTATVRFIPVSVIGLNGEVGALASGAAHSCALSAAGGVKCWGDNRHGQLGDGSNADRFTAVDVSGLSSGVGAIAVGEWHSCAVTIEGAVKCWGDNYSGQLGDDTTTDRWTPVDVSGLSSGASAIAAGAGHTCSLTNDGGVKCWGANAFGQLGDGTSTFRLTPVDVGGLSLGVSAIAAAGDHTCALTSGGGSKCWGFNDRGQLGDGTRTTRLTPVDVSGLGSILSAIAAGASHTCAITTTGAAKCWGNNFRGQLGIGGRNYGLPSDVLTTDFLFFSGFERGP
jgi:alpha-tubulin suppressor-like RCC1 family protein